MYSLISQRENALSVRDNAELKKISKSQADVALAATRDSAAMRIIAAITTVFLPATFTAVSRNLQIQRLRVIESRLTA